MPLPSLNNSSNPKGKRGQPFKELKKIEEQLKNKGRCWISKFVEIIQNWMNMQTNYIDTSYFIFPSVYKTLDTFHGH